MTEHALLILSTAFDLVKKSSNRKRRSNRFLDFSVRVRLHAVAVFLATPKQ